MQKLHLSLKLISQQIPRNISTAQSHLCNNILQTNPNPFYSFLTQPSQSHLRFTSWRNHSTVSKTFNGVLRTPMGSKEVVRTRNTHFQFPTGIFLLDRALLFARLSLRKQVSENSAFRSWSRFWRSWFPTTESAVWGLISANVAVFTLWRFADRKFMMENFMISVYNVTCGRLHTVITSAFSHYKIEHLFSNMIGLYFFGTSMANTFGPHFLVKLYLAGAVGGSIVYLIYHALQRPTRKGPGIFGIVEPTFVAGLGASGAVNAIILLDILLFPKAIHYVNLFIPVPAALLGALIVGTDVWRMMKGDTQISGSAHMGGALVALLYWARIRKRLF